MSSFQIEETANASSRTPRANTAHGAPANANADPSLLKRVRDDSREAFFRGL